MGFSITYRTTREVTAAEEAQTRAAADELIEGYTWLSCEPVTFYHELDEGRLAGFCKPNFMPHPDDIASALSEGLPDGTVNEMLDELCELSRRFRIDFELEHDESNGVAGYIRDGECEEDLRGLISAFGSLAEFSLDQALGGMAHESDDESEPHDDDDDDGGPSIIRKRNY